MRRVQSAPANIAAMAHSKKTQNAERNIKLLAVASKHTICDHTLHSKNEVGATFEMKTCMEDAVKEIVNSPPDDTFLETEQFILTTMLEHYVNKTEINFVQLFKNALIRFMLSFITHNIALFVMSICHLNTSIHIN